MYVGPCKELPTFPSPWLEIFSHNFVLLSLPLLYPCTVMLLAMPSSSNFSVFSHFHCLKIPPLYPHSFLPVSSSQCPLAVADLFLDSGKCHFKGMCVFAYLEDDTLACISSAGGGTKRDQAAVQCHVPRHVSDL